MPSLTKMRLLQEISSTCAAPKVAPKVAPASHNIGGVCDWCTHPENAEDDHLTLHQTNARIIWLINVKNIFFKSQRFGQIFTSL